MRARLEARKSKDFKESDRIRDELAKMGISLNDTKNKETGEIETDVGSDALVFQSRRKINLLRHGRPPGPRIEICSFSTGWPGQARP